MFIAKLSDAVVQWLVPATTAAACLPPEPCGDCVPGIVCDAQHKKWTVRMRRYVNNCRGQCTIGKVTVCRYIEWIGPC